MIDRAQPKLPRARNRILALNTSTGHQDNSMATKSYSPRQQKWHSRRNLISWQEPFLQTWGGTTWRLFCSLIAQPCLMRGIYLPLGLCKGLSVAFKKRSTFPLVTWACNASHVRSSQYSFRPASLTTGNTTHPVEAMLQKTTDDPKQFPLDSGCKAVYYCIQRLNVFFVVHWFDQLVDLRGWGVGVDYHIITLKIIVFRNSHMQSPQLSPWFSW